MQARRTKSSSPLGQLFDHGCDALSVHLLVGNAQVALASPCGLSSSVLSCMVGAGLGCSVEPGREMGPAGCWPGWLLGRSGR